MKIMLTLLENNLGAFITLIFTAIGLIIWFVRLESRISNLSERMVQLEKEGGTIITMANDIGIIKNDIKWLRERLDEVKEKVR